MKDKNIYKLPSCFVHFTLLGAKYSIFNFHSGHSWSVTEGWKVGFLDRDNGIVIKQICKKRGGDLNTLKEGH